MVSRKQSFFCFVNFWSQINFQRHLCNCVTAAFIIFANICSHCNITQGRALSILGKPADNSYPFQWTLQFWCIDYQNKFYLHGPDYVYILNNTITDLEFSLRYWTECILNIDVYNYGELASTDSYGPRCPSSDCYKEFLRSETLLIAHHRSRILWLFFSVLYSHSKIFPKLSIDGERSLLFYKKIQR